MPFTFLLKSDAYHLFGGLMGENASPEVRDLSCI